VSNKRGLEGIEREDKKYLYRKATARRKQQRE
jgi:hypothetical protein